jgi:hypothetical protein
MSVIRTPDFPEQIANCYQGLFDLMDQEHGKVLLISEMNDIIIECQKVTEKLERYENTGATESGVIG